MVQDLQIINVAVVPPPSHSILSVCNLGRNSTQCQVVYSPGSQVCILCSPLAKESQYLFAFEWEATGENTNRRPGHYYFRGSEIAPSCLGRLLAGIS